MKKLFFQLFLLAALTLLLYSCKDVINSDPNIAITREFNYNIKSDQEHGVIMPLKVGNYWIYKVSVYDETNSIKSIYYDSINVIKEEPINNEKWLQVSTVTFFVNDPFKKVYMTNTDQGLLTCNYEGVKEPYLLAKYPVSNETYSFVWHNSLPAIDGDSLRYWTSTEGIENLSTFLGKFSCIKYTKSLESLDGSQRLRPWVNEYYVPDFGLVRKELFSYSVSNGDTNMYKQVYELVKTNLLYDGSLVQYLTDFDFGQVSIGTSKVALLEDILVNNSTDTVRINFLDLSPQEPDLTIVSPPDLPFALIPGHSLPGIKIKLAATKQGIINQQLVIGTSAGIFFVNIKADRQ